MAALDQRVGRRLAGHGVEGRTVRPMASDEIEMRTRGDEVLNRWPTAGLAVGVVRDGSLAWFHGHDVAQFESGTPVDEDTVFRIASLTKTFSNRRDAALRARTGRPRRTRQRVPARLLAGCRQGRPSAADAAAPPDPHRRSSRCARALRSAPAGAWLEGAGRPPAAGARRLLPRGPAGRHRAGHQVGLLQSWRKCGPHRSRPTPAPPAPSSGGGTRYVRGHRTR